MTVGGGSWRGHHDTGQVASASPIDLKSRERERHATRTRSGGDSHEKLEFNGGSKYRVLGTNYSVVGGRDARGSVRETTSTRVHLRDLSM